MTVSFEVVVVASATVPVAVRAPVVRVLDVAVPRDDVPEVNVVIVAFVAVRLVKNVVRALKVVAKKFVDVAFVAKRLVVEAFVAVKEFVAVALVTVTLVKSPVVPVRVVIVDEDEVRSVIVAFAMVVVASDTVPVMSRR